MNDFYYNLVELIKKTIATLPESESELRETWIECLYELQRFQINADTEIDDLNVQKSIG